MVLLIGFTLELGNGNIQWSVPCLSVGMFSPVWDHTRNHTLSIHRAMSYAMDICHP